jgi:hypothetical protein
MGDPSRPRKCESQSPRCKFLNEAGTNDVTSQGRCRGQGNSISSTMIWSLSPVYMAWAVQNDMQIT